MPIVFRASDPIQGTQFVPGGNTPASAALLFAYVAGTSTKTTVYSDSGGTSAWANPIVLNSGGNLPNNGSVWIPTGVTVDFVLAPSNDGDPPTSPYWTKEDFSGVNDITAQEWVSGPTPTFVNSSTFTLNGDQSNTFTNSRKLRFTVTAGTVYGALASAAVATGSTTVNVAFNSGALDSGLTAVSYSLLSPNNPSLNADYINKKATAVPAAATTNIWGIDGDYVHITGSTQIGGFSSAPYAGAERDIVFDGTPTLVHGGNLQLPSGANIAVAANDRAKVRADHASTAVITFYERANGSPVVGTGLTFISSASALSSATLDFTGLTGFAGYVVKLHNLVPAIMSTDIFWRASTSNGASFDSDADYSYAINNFIAGAGGVVGAGSTATTAAYIAQNISNLAGYGVSATLNFNNLQGVANACDGTVGYRSGNANYGINAASSFYNGGSMNAIRFMAASSTIHAGSIYLYGVRGN